MKRGNTALKRGVGLASAFALAIAGAVIAAPAANAAALTVANLNVRATPAVDAANVPSTYTPSAVYAGASGVGTGAVPVIGIGSGQVASDIQITVPVGAAAKATFEAGNTFDVTLAGATWSTTPVAKISGVVDTSSLSQLAGHDGTGAHSVAAISTGITGDAPGIQVVGLSADKQKVTLKLTKDSQADAGTVANHGYLVSLSNVQVTVGNTTPAVVSAAVDATKETTIAYTSPYVLSVSDGYPANVKGDITLPDLTVTEQGNAAFANGVAYKLQVSGDAVEGKTLALVEGEAVVTPNVDTLIINGGTAGEETTVATIVSTGVTLTGALNTTASPVEAFTISGLQVSNLKPGATLTVSLIAAQAASNLPDTPVTTFSATPDQTAGASVSFGATNQPNRIAGDSRNATAAEIAKSSDGSFNVVLANGLDAKQGADALAANYLAGVVDGPILLTDGGATLPQATQAALVRLAQKAASGHDTFTIYIVGGTDSVSDAAADQAKFLVGAAINKTVYTKGVVVKRLSGANRYETSAAVVSEGGSVAVHSYNLGDGLFKTAFLASGTTNADALGAGALSAGAGIPVLLADGGSVNAKVVAAIKALGVKQLIVLGGTDRISDAAVDALKADGTVQSWTRVAGSDRYATNVALYSLAFKAISDKGLGLNLHDATGYLAGGFADALAVGPLAGQPLDVSPVLLVKTSDLGPAEQFLKDNKAGIDDIIALGQSDRVSNDVIVAAQKAIL